MVGFAANIEPMAFVEVAGYDPTLWPKRPHRQMLGATTSVLVTTSFPNESTRTTRPRADAEPMSRAIGKIRRQRRGPAHLIFSLTAFK
jgi:hypothetical protein